jgi:hypothetical protein
MKDETIRRTLQFFATFVRENQMPPQQIADLLLRVDRYIALLEDSDRAHEALGNTLQKQRDGLLYANEVLAEKVERLSKGLKAIVDNANNEPAAADYARDILAGKDVETDDGA